VEAEFNEDVEAILIDKRAQRAKRATLRASSVRQSIRVAEEVIILTEVDASPVSGSFVLLEPRGMTNASDNPRHESMHKTLMSVNNDDGGDDILADIDRNIRSEGTKASKDHIRTLLR
jgi:hypothetical protein